MNVYSIVVVCLIVAGCGKLEGGKVATEADRNLETIEVATAAQVEQEMIEAEDTAPEQAPGEAPTAQVEAAQLVNKYLVTSHHYTIRSGNTVSAYLMLGYYHLQANGVAARNHLLFRPEAN